MKQDYKWSLHNITKENPLFMHVYSEASKEETFCEYSFPPVHPPVTPPESTTNPANNKSIKNSDSNTSTITT